MNNKTADVPKLNPIELARLDNRHIYRGALNQFIESEKRIRKCISGISDVLDAMDESSIGSESHELLYHEQINIAFSSILAMCASEMERNFDNLEIGFRETEERLAVSKQAHA